MVQHRNTGLWGIIWKVYPELRNRLGQFDYEIIGLREKDDPLQVITDCYRQAQETNEFEFDPEDLYVDVVNRRIFTGHCVENYWSETIPLSEFEF